MSKKRILIVDDEEGFTRTAKLSLEKTGRYEVKTENKGSNGLTAAREFKPDLIFLDVMMPDMDGGTVASQIKDNNAIKDTPIVFLTAAVTREEVSSGGGVIGGNPFIAKPVSVKELINAINKHIG